MRYDIPLLEADVMCDNMNTDHAISIAGRPFSSFLCLAEDAFEGVQVGNSQPRGEVNQIGTMAHFHTYAIIL